MAELEDLQRQIEELQRQADELQRQTDAVRVLAEDAHDRIPARKMTGGASKERHHHDLGKHSPASAHGDLTGVTSAQHHTKYADADAISAVEGEATLDLAGDVTIAVGKSIAVDTISEKSSGVGVIVDGVTLIDGVVIAPVDTGHTITTQLLSSATSSTTVKGHAELATTAETTTGTDTSRVIPVSALPSQIQDNKYVFVADTASDDDYLIAPSPAIAAYATGQMFHFTAQTVNTGAATLNVNSKGAKAILKEHDVALANGDIEAGQIVTVIYDGTQFQMQSLLGNAPGGGGGTPTLIEDADQNTKVQVEESADENKVRMDVEGTQRFVLQTADPHFTLTGNVDIDGLLDMQENATASSTQINIAPTTTGVTAWNGIDINPSLTTTGNGVVCHGVAGQAITVGASASTGHKTRGLIFIAQARAVSSAVTYSEVTGADITAKAAGLITSGDITVTALIGIKAKTETQEVASGTATVTTMKGIEVAVSGTDSGTVTDYFGIHIDDYTQPSGDNFLIECGPATPYFRVVGNFTAAANATAVYISEGATPTLRQLKTKAGDTLGAGDLACVLV